MNASRPIGRGLILIAGSAGRRLVALVSVTRFRIVVAVLAIAASTSFLAVLHHRDAALEELPDVGEPFDIAQFKARMIVPESENAFEAYHRACSALTGEAIVFGRDPGRPMKVHWNTADGPTRDLLAANDEALSLWMAGACRPRAVCFGPGEIGFEREERFSKIAFGLRSIAGLVELKASRLESEGKAAEAWFWHRGLLRSSRHLGMLGLPIERFIGAELHMIACTRIAQWAEAPGVRPDLLKAAIREVAAIHEMTVKDSEVLKVEYLTILRSLDECDGWIKKYSDLDEAWYPVERAGAYLRNEPERSLRLARILIANHLDQADKPPEKRARPAVRLPAIFRPDPSTSSAGKALPPQFLASWFRNSLLERIWQPQFTLPELSRFERANQSELIVKLAKALYLKERGRPVVRVEELVGTYLDRLPQGYRDRSLPRRDGVGNKRPKPAAARQGAPTPNSERPATPPQSDRIVAEDGNG